MIQLIEEPEMFQRCLANPRFRAQFLLNPEAAALCEFAIHKDQEGYRRIKELTWLYILYIHKARKWRRQEMIQQGMNLPPHRPPNIDKPEQIPNKIKETWDSILQLIRIQKFPYTKLGIGRIDWDEGEIVRYQYLPIEVRYEWDKILANKHRLQMNRGNGFIPITAQLQVDPAPAATLHPHHHHYGLGPNNQAYQYEDLALNNQQYQWRVPQCNSVQLDYRTFFEMNPQLGANHVIPRPTYIWPQCNNLQLWSWMRSSLQWNSLYLLQDRWPL